MPDRNLREISIAVDGRIGALETKQRAMSTRVWPGAMRTGKASTFTPDVDPSAWNTMIQVLALPGRWLVLGQFDLLCSTPSSDVDFEFRLAAYSSTTGLQITGLAYDFPVYYFSWAPSTLIRFPVSLLGNFDNETDENLDIAMECREVNGRAWTTSNLRLKLIPR